MHTWKAARTLLEQSGENVNDAQQILEDLIRFATYGKRWSYKANDGKTYRMSYAGSGPDGPLYTSVPVRHRISGPDPYDPTTDDDTVAHDGLTMPSYGD